MTHSVGIFRCVFFMLPPCQYSFSSPTVANIWPVTVFILYHKTMHCTNSWHYNYKYNETALYDILAYSYDPAQLISICM